MLETLSTELKLRGFSPRTVKAYIYHNANFLGHIQKRPEDVAQTDIKQYLADLTDKSSPATRSLIKSSLHFFYDTLLGKNIVDFASPKRKKKLPTILSKEEVKKLIDAAPTIKSKCIIKLLYASGLRISECLNLKINDIELDQNIGWVREGKGGKDRMFILSTDLIKTFNQYLKSLILIFLWDALHLLYTFIRLRRIENQEARDDNLLLLLPDSEVKMQIVPVRCPQHR